MASIAVRANGKGLTALSGTSSSPRQTVANSSRTARKWTGATSQKPSPQPSTCGTSAVSRRSTSR